MAIAFTKDDFRNKGLFQLERRIGTAIADAYPGRTAYIGMSSSVSDNSVKLTVQTKTRHTKAVVSRHHLFTETDLEMIASKSGEETVAKLIIEQAVRMFGACVNEARNADINAFMESKGFEKYVSKSGTVNSHEAAIDMMEEVLAEKNKELKAYQDTVKRLSFEMEIIAAGGKKALIDLNAAHKAAMEQAADHLMEHGVVSTHDALVAVCKEIADLKPYDRKTYEAQ